MILRLAFLWMTVSVAACAQSTAVCPWFTTGSAVKVLGGDVTVTAHSESNWSGACRFARSSTAGLSTIEIQIGKTDTRPCLAGGTKITALGNEAIQCTQGTGQGRRDLIAGRVRDAYFVVSLSNVAGATQVASADARPPDRYRASGLEQVAEQVAGNLY